MLYLDVRVSVRLAKNENEIGHSYTVLYKHRSEKQCIYIDTSLPLRHTHTHTLCSLVFVKNCCCCLKGALKRQLACAMTPAAETSPLVIHCFNHSGSPTSYQPWQGLTHRCLLRALAPFVLFRTLSLSSETIRYRRCSVVYRAGKIQQSRRRLNCSEELCVVIPQFTGFLKRLLRHRPHLTPVAGISEKLVKEYSSYILMSVI